MLFSGFRVSRFRASDLGFWCELQRLHSGFGGGGGKQDGVEVGPTMAAH